MLKRAHSGDGCDLKSTLCKYELGKGATSGWELSLQSCKCVVDVCAVFCHCLLWLDA